VVEIDGEPGFVAADVCYALGVYIRANGTSNTGSALQKLGADEKKRLAPAEANRIGFNGAKGWGVSLISESGLYKLIMRSDKPQARKFQDWVTREVLPAIRKDGAYVPGHSRGLSGLTAWGSLMGAETFPIVENKRTVSAPLRGCSGLLEASLF